MFGMLGTLISFGVILAMLFGVLCTVAGEKSKGSTILVNCITVSILYTLILYMFTVGGSNGMFSSSIPFIDSVEKYGSVKTLLSLAPGEFSLCFVQLVTVIVLISFISNMFQLEQAGFAGKLMTRLIFVFAGLLLYGFVMDSIKDNIIIRYCIYIIETLLTGGSLVYTPIMIASIITGLKTDNYILIYIMQELPKTSLGKAISAGTTSAVLFVVMILVLESQYGSVRNMLQEAILLFESGGAILVMIMGLYIMLKNSVGRK